KLRRWHVPETRLSEIGNGIVIDDAERPAGQAAALRRELGIAADAFVVMNVGRLAEQKAQTDLIAAVAQVRAAHPNIQLLILGEGHLRAAIDEQIAAAGLRDSVRILGFKQNVGDYLAIADAFALPSVDEGLPIALLEALAARVPAVCTPVGATPGFLVHDVSVLFVPVHAI